MTYYVEMPTGNRTKRILNPYRHNKRPRPIKSRKYDYWTMQFTTTVWQPEVKRWGTHCGERYSNFWFNQQMRQGLPWILR